MLGATNDKGTHLKLEPNTKVGITVPTLQQIKDDIETR